MGLFTSDQQIIELAMEMSPIIALGIIPDHWQAMCNGVIRVLGLQSTALKFNLIAYWIIATSLTFILAFATDYGYLGLRIALFLA